MAKGGTKILFGFLFFVILVGALAGAGAWYLTETRVEGYRATATLLVANDAENLPGPPPRPDGPPPRGGDHREGLRGQIEHALGMAPPPPGAPSANAPPDYVTLFSTDTMAAALRDKLAAFYTEQGLEPVTWTLEGVRKAMDGTSQVALQTRDNVVYRNVLSLHFTAENPALSAAAANAWATQAQDFARELAREDQDSRMAAIMSELEKFTTEMAAAVAVRDEIVQSTDIDALTRRVAGESAANETLQAQLHSLEQNLARDEAALAALKTYVSKAPVAVVLELSVKEADLEATLAGSRAERDYVAQRVAALVPDQEDPRAVLADATRRLEGAESTIARLRPRIDALERARDDIADVPAPVRVVSEAVPPESPAGPHRYVIVAGAALLGVFLGMIVYFALLTLRVYARELDRA